MTYRDEVLRGLQLDIIRKLEWSGPGQTCPICEVQKGEKHKPRCELGRVLRKARKP
jgi:hypothetical protein